MKLGEFKSRDGVGGKPFALKALWFFTSALFVNNSWPFSGVRIFFLRMFGAKIGRRVILRPHVRIKYPWRLTVGNDCWIGESVWIDNLDDVVIEHDVCISQDAYLCTGSHDWSDPNFSLVTAPIVVERHSWICARATLGPGTHISEGTVVSIGCTISGTTTPWTVVRQRHDRTITSKRHKTV